MSDRIKTSIEETAFSKAVARAARGEDVAALAAELVAQMTDEEKLWCLDGDTEFYEGLADLFTGGIHAHTWPAARVERLGLPGIAFSDGPRGVVIGPATCFPVPMARGATWDPELEERIGRAIGREVRAVGATLFGGVCVNLLRHPGWGRAQETYGEDPLLVGEMGAALARGVQHHAMACVKHFACNSVENARFRIDVRVNERSLHEVYLPHFRRVVDEGVAAVMSAYNSVNGQWCGQNTDLLTRILRDEWGFNGIVISDFVAGLRDAVGSVSAGLDIEMPFRQQRASALADALSDGRLVRDDIERSVQRLVTTLLKFADRLTSEPPDAEVLACPEHRALAREAAARSIVLLRNESVGGRALLPLDPATLTSVAVIGRLAAEPNLGDKGSSDVYPPEVVTPLGGLRDALREGAIVHDAGATPERAAQVAAKADVAIVVVGLTYLDEGECLEPGDLGTLAALFPPVPEGFEFNAAAAMEGGGYVPVGDRRSLNLHEDDEVLIRAVAAANPRTVVAVMAGSTVLVESWHEKVAAILQLWYPGMEGGHALADVLLGRVEPSGRLPFAVPKEEAHLPSFDPDATECTYGLWHGQWLLDRDGHPPRYAFGFGLSYATARVVEATAVLEGDSISVEATLRNDGHRPAPEVVQVYAGLPGSELDRPARRLVGFARTQVPPGKTVTTSLTIPVARLAVRIIGTWMIEPGDYELTVGRHAGDPEARTLSVRCG